MAQLAPTTSEMSTVEAYTYSKGLLDRDKEEFEEVVLALIGRYGKDYDRFLKVIEEHIHRFQRKKDYIHNTFSDALLTYLFARHALENAVADEDPRKRGLSRLLRNNRPIKFVEFSPMWGWSTFLLLRAIRDSGKEDQVELWSYELSKDFARKAKENLRAVSHHIALGSLRLVNADALEEIKNKHADHSIDFLLIDSDHGREFTEKYLYDTRVFDKCKPEALVHIHDFKFWLDGTALEKWEEPEVLSRYFMEREGWVRDRILGQVFMLLGGSPDIAEMVDARRANPDAKYFSPEHNLFIRNHLPDQYWLGGTISNTNHQFSGSGSKGKTWLCGLAIWILPRAVMAGLE